MDGKKIALLFLLSAGAFAFLAGAMNLFALLLWPGYSPFLFISSLGALGVSATIVQIFQSKFKAWMTLFFGNLPAVTMGVLILLFLLISLFAGFGEHLSSGGFLALLPLWLISFFIFAVMGLMMGAAFNAAKEKVSFVTGPMLFGGAFGGLLTMIWLQVAGAPAAIIFSSIPVCAAGIIFLKKADRKVELAVSIIMCLVVVIILAVNFFVPFLENSTIHGKKVIAQNWAEISHLALVQGKENIEVAFDGTLLSRHLGGKAERENLKNLAALPFLLKTGLQEESIDTGSKTLALGPGALLILEEIGKRSESVIWIDENSMAGRLSELDGWESTGIRASLPNVTSIITNPKPWLWKDKRKFNTLFWTFLDMDYGDLAPPILITGRTLPTIQSMNAVLNKLEFGGLFVAITYAHPEKSLLRVLLMAKNGLRILGKANPETHVFAATDTVTSMLMVKKEPFAIHEVSTLRDLCEKNQLAISYSPYLQSPAGMIPQAATTNIFDFTAGSALYLPTDNKPSFFGYEKGPKINRHQSPLMVDADRLAKGREILKKGAGISLLLLVGVAFAGLFAVRAHRMALDRHARYIAFFTTFGAGSIFLLFPLFHMLRLWMPHPGFVSTWGMVILFFAAGTGSIFAMIPKGESSRLLFRLIVVALMAGALFIDSVCPLLIFKSKGLAGVFTAIGSIGLVGALSGFCISFALGKSYRRHRNSLSWQFAMVISAAFTALLAAPLFALTYGYAFLLGASQILLFLSIWLYGER